MNDQQREEKIARLTDDLNARYSECRHEKDSLQKLYLKFECLDIWEDIVKLMYGKRLH